MVLLGNGTQNCPIEVLSSNVLRQLGGLSQLADMSLAQMCEIRGIGTSKAALLQAAMELGQRVNHAQTLRQGAILSSGQLGEWLLDYFCGQTQELLIGIFLDTKNQVIDQKIIFKGTLNTSVAHPREIFHEAILRSAARFVVAHNHPSGDPTPSENDVTFTKRLVSCGELMGIECLDHLIVGSQEYLSLRAEKII